MNADQKTFEEVIKPVMEWLAKNKNPHTIIIVDATHAELLQGAESVTTSEFVPD